jgi:Tfp pilus assembly protein FimT
LVLVMTIMVVMLAFVAPSLRNSFKHRALDQEATRLLALTEYARDEAVSQGIPTQVWIDSTKGNYGAEEVPGFDGDKIDPSAAQVKGAPVSGVLATEYSLPDDVHFNVAKTSHLTPEGYTQVIQFDPDGSPTPSTGIDSVKIVDKDNNTAMLTLTTDGWGYEIAPEEANGTRH